MAAGAGIRRSERRRICGWRISGDDVRPRHAAPPARSSCSSRFPGGTSMILALLLAADTAKLPKWNPLPIDGSAEAAVMVPINRMFAGLEARDPAMILAQTRPD